ncbi:kinesin-like protein KIN-14C isoform X1 [Musa acuminata AAA Group]|uniref:kinesin-like protein KIN-14C isoform X1 n=2 Tax=Musa acuminata AAA Group TaxID=214697 RepID=UPI0008A0E856|nr:PREDICTED: kinesin-4-like isoform X1 [Musa acuminata subsp. malaccensis]
MNQGALLELPHADDSPASSKAEECTDLDMANLNIDAETAKRRSEVVEWLNYMIPDFNMSVEASAEELRARLVDGTVFCRILKRIIPASSEIVDGHCVTEEERLDNIGRFVSAVKKMGLPSFRVTDLQQGPVTAVVYCLWSLRDHLSWDYGEDKDSPRKFVGDPIERSKPLALNRPKTPKVLSVKNSQMEQHSVNSGENRINSFVDLRLKHVRQTNPVLSDPSTPRSHHSGHKFHELFQLKQGHYYELSAAKISEMMESNNLDNAPTQSLLSVINGILDENIERQNGEIPYRVACLLKKVVQEIERRISTQAEHIRNQNNLIKIREDKYHSRIRVLETLANTLNEETQMVMNQLQHLKTEKSIIEEKKKHAEEDVAKLRKEKENSDKIISELNQNLEAMKMSYNEQFHQLEKKERIAQMELEEKIKEAESLLEESRNRREEIEAISESKCQNWNKKENNFQCFINSYLRSVQGLRLSFDSIKLQIVDREKRWFEEFTNFGQKLKVLTDAAGNYHSVLEENRRLYNEVQELKGNIRVYCRIRPYLSGENKKQSTIYYIGENGELILANPTKQGKDGQRVFNFNKVFGPTATQEEVFLDTRPLIQSILDGYNVCIFAYGQTGSGKTYTMTGPDSSSETDWGVNYRALNDLFQISQTRIETFIYEVGVQMVEVYNEQVRDLLANDSTQKRLGIMTTSLPNGLAVPDASMHTVQSTLDVLELMGIGQTNRAVSATSLNERSSRSHSILTVHVQGMDLKTGATLRGSLHLVDLAGSERIERSEVIGERLKEAQHINKSLSALGDVIFALSQKNTHVPYRNSKLTQVLQSSLGGHAKTLMFVHINPDVGSYSETLSTLKFAERVSGVELGAARSQKEGKDVRDLMEQVTSLKDTIAKKDEEIEQLKLKAFISRSPSIKNERNSNNFLRYNSFSPARTSTLAGTMQHKQRTSTGKLLNNNNEAARKSENCSEIGDHFEYGSQKSVDDNKNQDTFMQLKHTGGISAQASADIELLGFGDEDAEEHLSDISDGVLSMGTETDGSLGSVVEFSLFPEQKKSSEAPKVKMPKIPASIPKPPPKKTAHSTAFLPKTNNALRPPTSLTMPRSRKSTSQVTMSSPARPPRRWQ